MSKWYQVKAKFTKQHENGEFKRVSEVYLFQGETFTDVEAAATKELNSRIKGEVLLPKIVPVNFDEVVLNEADNFYNVKVGFISVTEEKEKKTVVTALINAENIADAIQAAEQKYKDYYMTLEIMAASISPILEIFPYKEESEMEESIDDDDDQTEATKR